MNRWTERAASDQRPTPWLALVLLTCLAVALRSVGLDGGMWWDELRTLVDSVRSPLRQILTVFPGDNQHTLYSVLAHVLIGAFGEHAWSLRLPAMVLGAATVPVLYFFAREIVGRTEALLASALLAVAYHHVWFSQNARGYTTLAFLALLSSWLLLRGLRRGKTSDFAWYGIAAALGAYTHLTMVMLVASHALACVLPLGLPVDRPRLLRWRLPAMGFVTAGILTLLLYSPVLWSVQQAVVDAPSPMSSATPRWALLELLRGLRIGLGSGLGLLAGGALFLAGMRSYLRQSPFILGIFLLPGALAVAAAVALHRPVRPRFVFFLIGFALLIVVRGALEIGRLFRGRAGRAVGEPGVTAAGIALVGGLVLMSLAALPVNYRYPKQDFDGAMRFVDAQRAPGEPVLTAGGASYPYREYYGRDWPRLDSLMQFQQLRTQGQRVWVVYTLASYIEGRAPDLMNALRAECAVASVFRGTVGGGEITVCTAPPTTP